ncbi:NADPH-dependent 2,4-dienoyl-CoA reductase, sulfur reductase [Palleronia marisminoris]|uniref:Sulfide dehydrogenase [flavocytochrome c] flavoprotein chain n=1 Tax=Palleronia marisminoris TaxID=315423 RepID=A0A1Y5RZB4_9RHOB|nr:NAD(P)/FAD-dependent oxidoreductase [Palleronia marisminoris]SFG39791.1 NADPH-dependent 2,4-dienoyl-CoA reductase, sulfur reductase [Palleronia marisminoris]SLN29084.1 Sulfide dehydrogenase [flavocytochrome c] flavoprotein chain precursor [Palleronia marisminoris]
MTTDRRTLLKGLGATAALTLPHPVSAQSRGRVVVVGGGFGGATAARFLARIGHDVTLVERDPAYVTCPFSNAVIGGFYSMPEITFDYAALEAEGVRLVTGAATEVGDGAVTLDSGEVLPFDRLLLSPGVEMRFDALPGYTEAAAQKMPHAWKAGPQTALLQAQLADMEDGGLVVIAPPANPYRCPPGPYERASLIAHYLSARKPASKILILDAKEAFSKQPLFEEAWSTLYPGMIDWIPPSMGGRVAEVDPTTMTVVTDFDRYEAAVANIIPPQQAATIARAAGVTDETGWCPVSGVTFESDLVAGIHVIGDACFAGVMPKSAFSANAQAKVAAVAIDALLRGEAPNSPKLLNTCYSLAAPDYAFTVAGVYGEADGKLFEVEGAGGLSPLGAPAAVRSAEAEYARSWYATITTEAFA